MNNKKIIFGSAIVSVTALVFMLANNSRGSNQQVIACEAPLVPYQEGGSGECVDVREAFERISAKQVERYN